MQEKSHTCEERGEHLIISFFYLLMKFEKLKKSEFLKNEKKRKKNCRRYHHFHITIVPKIMIISYTVPEIRHVTYVIVIFHFGLFFALLPPSPPHPLKAQKIKFLKKWKNTWRYHHFNQVYQKLWLDDVQYPRYGAHGQKKWHIQLGTPPKNICLINIQLST